MCGSDEVEELESRLSEMTELQAANEKLREAMNEIYSHLAAAISQSIPTDDQIIMGHVRDACKIAEEN